MKIPRPRTAGGTATGVTAAGGGSAPPLYREALVVFAGNSDIWWLGGLKSGFRHCFIAFNDGRHWITLDPLSHRTEVMVQEVPADFDLRAFYEEQGMRCVTATLAPNPDHPAGDDPAGDDPAGDADPDEADADAHLDTVPDRPEDYRIDSDHPWLGNDAELNGILHENGFSRGQAQIVYDLAHEYVLPLLDKLAGEIAGLRGERQLREVFPGDDWEARAEQTRQWGADALPADIYETLAANPAGVAAMHRMMQHGEPGFLSRNGPAGPAVDEAALRSLMNDPRYWRDHDPSVIAKVQDGFQRLYPD